MYPCGLLRASVHHACCDATQVGEQYGSCVLHPCEDASVLACIRVDTSLRERQIENCHQTEYVSVQAIQQASACPTSLSEQAHAAHSVKGVHVVNEHTADAQSNANATSEC